ncbi:hypothetical protein CLOM_g19121 [Closterium sp. NIES-68]|nr:hypothetical protein CLOM_g19121 [Closterium sp. NIES-68]GJP59462.1 hypothetical protein CLOP_g12255 [Closterium sp. NIES-67]
MGAQNVAVQSPVVVPSQSHLPQEAPALDWPVATLPRLRTRGCARTQSPGGTRPQARERILSTSDALGLSPRTLGSGRRRSYSPASPQSAEGWAETLAGRRRKELYPLNFPSRRSASALISPSAGGSPPPSWRPAALTTVRSPLAPVVRHKATASVDMEQLWAAEVSFDESGGGGEAPSPGRRRNRGIIRGGHARNLSFSDFRSFRTSALGKGEATGADPGADSAEQQAESPSASRRRGGAAAPFLRILSSRGGRDSTFAASAAAAVASVAAPAAVFASCTSPRGTAGGDDVARSDGFDSLPPRRTMRDSLLRGTAGLAVCGGGAAVPVKSPPWWRGRGSAGRAGMLSESAGRSFSGGEPATAVPFAAREADKRESQQLSPQSQPPSQQSLGRSRSWGQQAGEEILLRLRAAHALGGESNAANGGNFDETDGEGSARHGGAPTTATAESRHHEAMMEVELEEYFGEVAQSWRIDSLDCSVDAQLEATFESTQKTPRMGGLVATAEAVAASLVSRPSGEAERGGAGGERQAEGVEGEGRAEASWRMCSLSSGMGGGIS